MQLIRCSEPENAASGGAWVGAVVVDRALSEGHRGVRSKQPSDGCQSRGSAGVCFVASLVRFGRCAFFHDGSFQIYIAEGCLINPTDNAVSPEAAARPFTRASHSAIGKMQWEMDGCKGWTCAPLAVCQYSNAQVDDQSLLSTNTNSPSSHCEM